MISGKRRRGWKWK